MPEALHLYARPKEAPHHHLAKQRGRALPRAPPPPRPRPRPRTERFERHLAGRLDLCEALRSLHAKPAVLREQRHDAGYGAHGAGEERARARVGGEVRAALLQLAELVARAVDLAREAHGEAVPAADGGL